MTAALLAATFVVAVGAQEASAASKFDAGNIIDDSVFFDSDSMTVKEIQKFLDSKGGDLADYTTSSKYKENDAYCDGYKAKSGQTAAQIIKGVSESCNINPRVLLVTLQKETSLVTRTNTSAWYYKRAMGYGCPDSNLSTSVDANQDGCYDWAEGFFQQVYHMAKQFQLYAKKPNSYSYKAGQSNKIKYNPYCSGYSWVYIENQATAGLYNYTPYQPNDAVLNGTSGSCKSYGNYNFFTIFTSWFGSTKGESVDQALVELWNDEGGLDGPGIPLEDAVTTSEGTYQKFKTMYLFVGDDGSTAALPKNGALAKAYFAAGGPDGSWGWPTTSPYKRYGVWRLELTETNAYLWNGTVETSNRAVKWELIPTWIDEYDGRSTTGHSKDSAVTTDDGIYQRFGQGYLFLGDDGSHAFLASDDALTTAYFAASGPDGDWGWPLAAIRLYKGVYRLELSALNAYRVEDDATVSTSVDPVNWDVVPTWIAAGGFDITGSSVDAAVQVDGGAYQEFENGHVFASDDGDGAFLASDGALTTPYLSVGGPEGEWGWPTRSEYRNKGVYRLILSETNAYSWEGEVSTSQRPVYWDLIPSWIDDFGGYESTGSTLSSAVFDDDGTYQQFEEGYLYLSTEGTAAFLDNDYPLTEAYLVQGGPDVLGDAVGDPVAGETITYQEFENGWLYAVDDGTSGVLDASYALAEAYLAEGGEATLGAAVEEPITTGDGVYQEFDNGWLFDDQSGHTAFLTRGGPITDAYFAAGGPDGEWGWPLASPLRHKGIFRVAFTHTYAYNWQQTIATSSGTVNWDIVPTWIDELGAGDTTGDSVASAISTQDGVYQEFDNGWVFVGDDESFAYLERGGPITDAYFAAGGPTGEWGWPTASARLHKGVFRLTFTELYAYNWNGTVSTSEGTVNWDIVPAWIDDWDGFATTGSAIASVVSTKDGVYQEFEDGWVFDDGEGNSAFLTTNGKITRAYISKGWVGGSWGWPTAGAVKVDEMWTVYFTKVTVRNDGGTLVVTSN